MLCPVSEYLASTEVVHRMEANGYYGEGASPNCSKLCNLGPSTSQKDIGIQV